MKPISYRIKVLELAARDVQAQFDYIHDRSPIGARLWYEAYLDALERLKVDPKGLSLAPESEHVEDEIRQIFFKTRRGNPYRLSIRSSMKSCECSGSADWARTLCARKNCHSVAHQIIKKSRQLVCLLPETGAFPHAPVFLLIVAGSAGPL